MGADCEERIIFIEGEPLLDAAEAYEALLADIFIRLDAVPTQEQFNQDLENDQEALRFRRRHLLLAALRSIVNHSVAADARTLPLQGLLMELSQAVREFAHDVESLDHGFSATLIASPAPFEAGETPAVREKDLSLFVPDQSKFISAERQLILYALALSSVHINGLTLDEVRRRSANTGRLNPDVLKAQSGHLNKCIKLYNAAGKTAEPAIEKGQRFTRAEIAFYQKFSKKLSKLQKDFQTGKIVIDETDEDAPRSVFDLAKVILYALGSNRLKPSTVKPRKR